MTENPSNSAGRYAGPPSSRRAVIRLGAAEIAQLIQLPEWLTLTGIHADFATMSIELSVQSDHLPRVAAGAQAPNLNGSLTRHTVSLDQGAPGDPSVYQRFSWEERAAPRSPTRYYLASRKTDFDTYLRNTHPDRSHQHIYLSSVEQMRGLCIQPEQLVRLTDWRLNLAYHTGPHPIEHYIAVLTGTRPTRTR